MKTVNLISKAEYARHRGVTSGAVCNAIRRGKITAARDGRIDPVAADAQWEATRQRHPPVKSRSLAELQALVGIAPPSPCHDPDRQFDYLGMWLCWRFPGTDTGLSLAEMIEVWAWPIKTNADLVHELTELLRVFAENLKRQEADSRMPTDQ